MATKTKLRLNDILRVLQEQLPNLKARFGVRSLGLFGSYVRGEEKRGSDLDVLVGFVDESPSFRELDDLQYELTRLVGVRVDLAPEGGLKPYVGRRVMEEIVDVEWPGEGLARLDKLRAEGKLSRPRETRDSLRDILNEVENVEQFAAGLDYDPFVRDPLRVRAVLHSLLIIGEATRNLPMPVRSRYPEVPYRRIVHLRNRVAHAYFEIELPRIWNIIHDDLPTLREAVTRILAELEREGREQNV